MKYPASELILHKDGSVYHLGLRPEDLADTVITVGDPERVKTVSSRLDRVEICKQNREFVTHTGWLGRKRISVVSTGIGTDNIDIVFNELDALANIDLLRREPFDQVRSLDIIRIGTAGSLQEDLPVDSFVRSVHAIGMDNLLHFYARTPDPVSEELLESFSRHMEPLPVAPYIASCAPALLDSICRDARQGFTLTCPGFYAPQGRQLRYRASQADWLLRASSWSEGNWRATNFEMETAGIYGLSEVLGHKALSLNAVIANRVQGRFSSQPEKTVIALIEQALADLS